MNPGLNFSDQKVLVTGSTTGIGAAIVNDFLELGAHVMITGYNQEELDLAREKNQEKKFHNAEYIHVDFNDETSLSRFLTKISKLNELHVCINNAGSNRNNPIDETRIEDYDYLHQVNLKSPFLICREVSKIMKKQKYGRIVNIASIWSVISRAKRSVYSITKFGIVGLTKSVSADLAPYGILVNAVSPGFTLTELTKKTVPENEIKMLSNMIPMQRFAEPSEISKIVIFLSSSLNTYLTGQNVIIDGGFTSV